MPFWNSPQYSLKNQRKSIWCTLPVALLQKRVRWPPFFISWLWKRYDYVATGKLTTDGKEIRKITLVDKCTKPLKELYEYFIQLTFCSLLLSCQVVMRTTRFSPWKPSSWSCCLYSRLFWALCLPFPWWNSIWIFWHQQSQSPCHHSLQAHKWRNRWCSEYRGGTCNLQKAFVCHF